MEKRLIDLDKSVIVAADLPFYEHNFSTMVDRTISVKSISGYKIGPESVLNPGLKTVVSYIKNMARRYGKGVDSSAVIYDHQKAGNDIPEFGPKFMLQVAEGGVDAVILFPFSSPVTQEEWTKSALELGLIPIVGGHMTHKKFLRSEDGYIADDAPERIYRSAAQQGVKDFVVPGNKPEFVSKYREILEEELGVGNFVLYAPGFISQGGNISETGKVAGEFWHAIVGSAIYKANDIHEAALQVTAQI